MLKEGLSYTSTLTVAAEHTAAVMGSGDMQVLATPALVALMENAAMRTVHDLLPDGTTTVGGQIDVKHLRASALGAEVKAHAVLEKADGAKLHFRLQAFQDDTLIGEGTHLRFIVEREAFLARL